MSEPWQIWPYGLCIPSVYCGTGAIVPRPSVAYTAAADDNICSCTMSADDVPAESLQGPVVCHKRAPRKVTRSLVNIPLVKMKMTQELPSWSWKELRCLEHPVPGRAP